MNENNNAVMNSQDQNLEDIDLALLDDMCESIIDSELEKLDFLEEERKKIENPDELGKVILNEVWNQFGNQIGLDLTKETLIQKYDREHPETYDEVSKKVMQDPKYKNANKAMKEKQQSGNLEDKYTGKTIKQNEKANLDHTVSRKEISENPRRKQANIPTEKLANKSENLNATNESLNKSKGAKSVKEYTDPKNRKERENKLKEQNEAANKKIDQSNKSAAEKRQEKEKNDKRLQDKLDADNKKMQDADKKARKAINSDIRKGVAKETAKKAGIDALKTMAVSALFDLLKEVMNGLVRFFKEKSKSFKTFLGEMKESIKHFVSHISNLLHTGVSNVIGTVVSEIFGPIVSLFKSLSSIIKQGASFFTDAVRYLTNKKNKNQPISIKIAEVGKIVTKGLVGVGAIFGGEVIEKALIKIPGMQIKIPLLGSLAKVCGLFFSSMIFGIIGAIVINLINKSIANKQISDIVNEKIDTQNKIIATQIARTKIRSAQLQKAKQNCAIDIEKRHEAAANEFYELHNIIVNDEQNDAADNNQQNSNDLIALLET